MENSWVLSAKNAVRHVVTISAYLSAGQGILALPPGTVRIENLPLSKMETNRLGTVKVSGGPGLATFDARFTPELSLDGAPGNNDTNVPAGENVVLGRIVGELELNPDKPRDALAILSRYFTANFSYSTWVAANAQGDTNVTLLANFLLNTRAGHCEYFATASTLLLRKAGIPARYVVGYSVSEKRGENYIARERDAHAWCLAWVEGHWLQVDNTPASWHQVESQHSSFVQAVKDFFSDLWFRFSVFRWSKSNYRQYAVWAVVPLLIVVVYRLARQRRKRKLGDSAESQCRRFAASGLDSEFYAVERRLAELGLGRLEQETWESWGGRIKDDSRVSATQLRLLISLHYRLRFDPEGLPTEDRRQLQRESADLVRGWQDLK